MITSSKICTMDAMLWKRYTGNLDLAQARMTGRSGIQVRHDLERLRAQKCFTTCKRN